MESNVKVRKGSVLKPMTNTKENDKACCKDGGCIIFWSLLYIHFNQRSNNS